MKIVNSVLIFLLLSIVTTFSQADLPAGNFGMDDEPLMPDQAFKMSTKVLSADMLRVQWDIVDGYYLYRDKFKFSSSTSGIEPQLGIYPKGKIKHDEFFGEVETYRGKINIDIPITRDNDATTLDLSIVSQGCADIGICYPPQTKKVSLTLPPKPPTAISSSISNDDSSLNPLGALKRLGKSLGLGGEDDFLKPDQAFVFSAEAENGNLITAHWDIEDGYYLYRDKFSFSLEDANGIEIGQISMPKGKTKIDESFGEMVVYFHEVDIPLPLLRTSLGATEVNLVAKYQGCSEKGLCYPPIKKTMPIALPAGQDKPAMMGNKNNNTGSNGEMVSEQDQISNALASGNTLLTLITFFGFGLLLAFTPCVFPMIPILSSIIIGQGENVTTRKAFIMSLVYVLAMASTYTVAGVIAGSTGDNIQAAFQNPWILSSFAAVFVALAFSMFGFYDIQMPASIQSKLTEISNKQQGGNLFGVAIMGFLSALIVGPCVAAPLAGALIYIGQTGDMVLGGMALFALSMGMGAPLLVIGTSAGKLLPRAGTWMDTIKSVFGVLMIAVAIWMLERVVSAEIAMLMWAGLLIVSAIYMRAIEPLGEASSGWQKLWKGLGFVILIYGVLLLIGVASGSKHVMQPLMGISSSGGGNSSSAHQGIVFKQIKGLKGLEKELAAAKAAGKYAMLDLYADWCVSCKEMEKYTFSDAQVQRALGNVVLLQADVTLNDEQDKALMSQFGLHGPPSILFFTPDGKERRGHRLVGFLNAEKFKAHIDDVLK